MTICLQQIYKHAQKPDLYFLHHALNLQFLNQFLARTPKFGSTGSEGYFIWPTMRRVQPDIIKNNLLSEDNNPKDYFLRHNGAGLSPEIGNCDGSNLQ